MKTSIPGATQPPPVVSNAAHQKYPLNAWYIVAARDEIGQNLLGRQICGNRVVIYRKSTGEPVVLSDWCPHRGFKLSESRLVGDNIVCGYHGMTFNGDGKCIHIPSQTTIPNVMKVRSYPVAEMSFWVWAWMGDPEKANRDLLPESEFFNRPHHHDRHIAVLPMNGNFQLLHENLIDATHVSYLHEGLVDNEGEDSVATVDAKVDYGKNFIRTQRDMPNYRPRGNVAKVFQVEEGLLLIRRLINEHHFPCMCITVNQLIDPKTEQIVSEQIGFLPVVPASPTSCYHFAAISSSFPARPLEEEIAFYTSILNQDTRAIESSQQWSDETGAREISIREDEVAIRARRMIAEMVRGEQSD
jgi:vanillate O-demethylase monooxygenase subunit